MMMAVRIAYFQVIGIPMRMLGLTGINCLVGGLLFATPVFGLTALVLLTITTNLVGILAVSLFSYMLAVALMTALLYPVSNVDLEQTVAELRKRLTETEFRLSNLESTCKLWWDRHYELLAVRQAKEEYEVAHERHQKLIQLLRSRRYQLIQTDWRSLRGIAFEDFLGDVFEELGYSVDKTKTTGDQGVDLILTGKGGRIAVQAKGYKDNVGNGSVQEVYWAATRKLVHSL
jgi:hypothetical protein